MLPHIVIAIIKIVVLISFIIWSSKYQGLIFLNQTFACQLKIHYSKNCSTLFFEGWNLCFQEWERNGVYQGVSK